MEEDEDDNMGMTCDLFPERGHEPTAFGGKAADDDDGDEEGGNNRYGHAPGGYDHNGESEHDNDDRAPEDDSWKEMLLDLIRVKPRASASATNGNGGSGGNNSNGGKNKSSSSSSGSSSSSSKSKSRSGHAMAAAAAEPAIDEPQPTLEV